MTTNTFTIAITENGDLGDLMRKWGQVASDAGRFTLTGMHPGWAQLVAALEREGEPHVLVLDAGAAPSVQEIVDVLGRLSNAVALVLLPDHLADQEGVVSQIHTVHKVMPASTDAAKVLDAAHAAANTHFNVRAAASAEHSASKLNAGREFASATGTKVLGLVSAEGGTGKTAIAEALAFELQARRSITTLLFALNQPTPSINHLDLTIHRTALEFFDAPATGLAAAKQAAQRHGFEVVIPPQNPVDYEQVAERPAASPDSIKALVQAAYNQSYGTILLDLPPGLGEWSVQPLLASNHVLIVARPTISSMTAVAQLAHLLTVKLAGLHRFERDKIFVVLNQRSKHSTLNRQSFTTSGRDYVAASERFKALEGWFPPCIAAFEYDAHVPVAQDNQAPITDRSSGFGDTVKALADSFFPAAGSAPVRTTAKKFLGIKVTRRQTAN